MFNFIHTYADRCSQKENAFCMLGITFLCCTFTCKKCVSVLQLYAIKAYFDADKAMLFCTIHI